MNESHTHGCGTMGAGSHEHVEGADVTPAALKISYGAELAPNTPHTLDPPALRNMEDRCVKPVSWGAQVITLG